MENVKRNLAKLALGAIIVASSATAAEVESLGNVNQIGANILAAGCGGGQGGSQGGCGAGRSGRPTYRQQNTAYDDANSYSNPYDSNQNRYQTSDSNSQYNTTRGGYTQPTYAADGYSTSSMQSSSTQMTDDDKKFADQLTPQMKAMYQNMSPQGRQLARQIAANKDKNTAVKEALRKMSESAANQNSNYNTY